MYKNLLYLKTYDGNVEDLGLDFTIVNSEIGQTQVRNHRLHMIYRNEIDLDHRFETEWSKYLCDR
jgi:hypothetical protein